MRLGIQALITLWLVASSVSPAHGDELIQWHTENVQLLRGSDYELGDQQRTILTFEHANRWRYGDVFLFADFTSGDDGLSTAYGEITPRFSLSRMTGQDWSWGVVRDVLIAATYEHGDEGIERYLAGIAIDLDIPDFTFVRVHAFRRDDPRRAGSTWQSTIVWNRRFSAMGQQFLAEGVADFAGSEGNGVANQFIVPRLLWDIGALNGDAGRLYLGIEHQYWNNKFGVDGVVESVTQLQLKWVLH
jgi:nucleoside-specific outer membrane channel protein Tsx